MKKTPTAPAKPKVVKAKVAKKPDTAKQIALGLKVDKQITAATEMLKHQYIFDIIKKAGGTLYVKAGPVLDHIREIEQAYGGGVFDSVRTKKPWLKLSISENWKMRNSSAV